MTWLIKSSFLPALGLDVLVVLQSMQWKSTIHFAMVMNIEKYNYNKLNTIHILIYDLLEDWHLDDVTFCFFIIDNK